VKCEFKFQYSATKEKKRKKKPIRGFAGRTGAARDGRLHIFMHV
jgi:hypothetical protein